MFRAFFFIVLVCVLHLKPLAQPLVYQLDVAQGLPSNRFYEMMTDRHGALWIATPEGVVQYNGYDVRVFDVSDGLPVNDVWELYEDARGRIWLLSFAQSIGYIYNGEYHKTYAADPSIKILPVPHSIGDYGGGIFLDNNTSDSAQYGTMLIEHNDTLYPYYYPLQRQKPQKYFVGRRNLLQDKLTDPLWTYTFQTWKPEGLNRSLRNMYPPSGYKWWWMFYHYFLGYGDDSTGVEVYNEITGQSRKLALPHSAQRVKAFPGDKRYFNLLLDSILYQYDHALDIPINVWNLSVLGDHSFDMVSCIEHSTQWGLCCGVSGKGVFIVRERPQYFQLVSEDMSEYQVIGTNRQGQTYWWSDFSRKLLVVDSAGAQVHTVLQDYKKAVRGLLPWDQDKALLIAMDGPIWLDLKQYTIFPPADQKQNWLTRNSSVFPKQLWRISDVLLYDTSELYLLSRLYGFVKVNIAEESINSLAHPTGSSAYGVVYNGIVHDPVSGSVFTYGNTEVVIHRRQSDKNTGSPVVKLNSPLLTGIEQVLIDQRYGNIFFKKGESLYLINRSTGIVSAIEGNINVHKAMVTLHDDKLIVAGRFGVAVYKINGVGRVSAPIIYEQIKNEYYSTVASVGASNDFVYVNSDMGLFKCPMPSESAFRAAAGTMTNFVQNMRILVHHVTGAVEVNSGDTVFLPAASSSLQFDLVNPTGNGAPRFSYYIHEKEKKTLKTGRSDLTFSGLKADRYYTLRLQVADDAKKRYVEAKVYVTPLWWQAGWMQRLLIVTIIVVLILLAWFTAWITRRIVVQNNNRKNMQMEIELKSIYAQINPHFINNTLNSVLALIKSGNMNDAFYNVSRFSRLLRAYIKSSRNRYIDIADEIENLKNYIELQQVRFRGKFDYRISIEGDEPMLKATKIPSLLLQPLVENAINHGLFHRPGNGGMLEIIFKQGASEREIICIIDDNGIGRKASDMIQNRNKIRTEESYGSVLIQELIGILNRYEQVNIQIEYRDKQPPETGTVVTLIIRLPWTRG